MEKTTKMILLDYFEVPKFLGETTPIPDPEATKT